MDSFWMKSKKEEKCWITLIQHLRWLDKVFSVIASLESLVLTLSYFQLQIILLISHHYRFIDSVNIRGYFIVGYLERSVSTQGYFFSCFFLECGLSVYNCMF